MQSKNLVKASVLCLTIVIAFIAGWEMYLRNTGLAVDYDDGDSLWSDKRGDVYQSTDRATVFIGSSRIKYDLDIDTWQALTGLKAVQLAIEGNSPLPVLDDLANDKNFKGNLIVDVTEGLFFSSSPENTSEPKSRIAAYEKRTPAQRFSFQVNHILESKFVFLDKYSFSLNALLDNFKLPNRPGVFVFPHFPMEFGRVTFERQDKMTDKFLTDTSLQNQVKNIWEFFRKIDTEVPVSGVKLDSILITIKSDCDRIKSRGGNVLFVRTPSSGPYLAGENMGYPRTKYWDRLLAFTNCPGIHFKDYPAIANFQCPEFSHLQPKDAVVFTENLIKILKEEKGWSFKKM